MAASAPSTPSPQPLVPAPALTGRRARPRLTMQVRDNLFGLLLLTPMLVMLTGIILYPLIYGISRGFYSVQLLTLRSRFLGFDNFRRILFDSTDFYRALWIDIEWSVSSVVLQLIIGVAIALLLNQSFHGRAIARGLLIFPFLAPIIVVVLVWKWMFNDLYGIINYVLTSWGITHGPVLWLSTTRWSLVSVVLASSWRLFPFIVVLVLARLQTIPRELYEAAKADGASRWASFRDVTLPQLKGVLIIAIFLRFIFEFNDFNFIALMTGGGPAASTQTIPIFIQQQGFAQQRLGVAAAGSDLMLLCEVAFCVAYFLLVRKVQDR